MGYRELKEEKERAGQYQAGRSREADSNTTNTTC
jgi:hypothetical protein